MSRTVRLTQFSTPRPTSARSGPTLARPWVGLSPTNPQHDAGMRMLPPPSEALANGHHPGGDRGGRRLRWSRRACVRGPTGCASAPHAIGWVVGRLPISGLFVRPAITRPAALKRETSVVSDVSTRAAARQGGVAVGQRLPGEARVEVLEQERHPAERAVGKIGVGGDVAGVVEPADHDRVECGVEALDALDRRVEQLARCDLALGDQGGLVDGVHPAGLIGERRHHSGVARW